jgi:hypothetical protein
MTVGWYVALIRPQKEAIVSQQAEYVKQKGIAADLDKSLQEEAKAKQNLRYVQGQLQFLRSRYRNMYFDFGNEGDSPDRKEAKQNLTWRRWLNEYYSGYGLALQRELINAANDSGVIIHTSFKVDAPPKAPEEVVPPPNGFFKPTGGALGLDVTGTLSAIMAFLRRLNSMSSDILLVVGNIKLEGTSPQIKATFSVTPYLLATGKPVTLKGVAAAAPAAPAGAPPGGAPPAGAPPAGAPPGPPE